MCKQILFSKLKLTHVLFSLYTHCVYQTDSNWARDLELWSFYAFYDLIYIDAIASTTAIVFDTIVSDLPDIVCEWDIRGTPNREFYSWAYS